MNSPTNSASFSGAMNGDLVRYRFDSHRLIGNPLGAGCGTAAAG